MNISIHITSKIIKSALWYMLSAVNCFELVWLETDVLNDKHGLLLPTPHTEECLVPYESPLTFHTQWKWKNVIKTVRFRWRIKKERRCRTSTMHFLRIEFYEVLHRVLTYHSLFSATINSKAHFSFSNPIKNKSMPFVHISFLLN